MEQIIAIILAAIAWAWGLASPPPCPPTTTVPAPVSIPGPTIPEYAPPIEHPGVTIPETTNILAATADRPYDPATDDGRYLKP